MGRKLHSCLPQTTGNLIPQWPYIKEFKEANKKFKEEQKRDYDHCHRATSLPEIPENTDVWVTKDDQNTPGQTVRTADTPRSYIVQTPSGELQRNRSQLNINLSASETQTTVSRSRSPIKTRSHTGTTITPPMRFT